MLINRVHIYIFGILKHQGLMPCTRFKEVKRLPGEKVLKHTVRHRRHQYRPETNCTVRHAIPNMYDNYANTDRQTSGTDALTDIASAVCMGPLQKL